MKNVGKKADYDSVFLRLVAGLMLTDAAAVRMGKLPVFYTTCIPVASSNQTLLRMLLFASATSNLPGLCFLMLFVM